MENTVIEGQDNSTGTVNDQENRTFTQQELDEIVKARIAKERAKYTDYEDLKAKASKFDEIEEANKSELEKITEKAAALEQQLNKMTRENEIRSVREKVSMETGVPINLLFGDSEDICREQAAAVLAYANKCGYPSVKDGGEVQNIQHKNVTDQFADWFNASINNQ